GEAERARLREPRLSDFEAFAVFYTTESAHFVGGPRPKGESWRGFAAVVGHWHLKGFGWWVIEADGVPVGSTGVHFPPTHADLEIGWVLFPSHQGRGLALETALAARAWARANLPPQRLVSYIDAANAPSRRLAERLGAAPEEGRAAHDPECLVYLHPGEHADGR
ncbi:MAG: GNAT family N-acetyltransferase, partial [Planctomycetota bacterium]